MRLREELERLREELVSGAEPERANLYADWVHGWSGFCAGGGGRRCLRPRHRLLEGSPPRPRASAPRAVARSIGRLRRLGHAEAAESCRALPS
jgi:hypothetical protein